MNLPNLALSYGEDEPIPNPLKGRVSFSRSALLVHLSGMNSFGLSKALSTRQLESQYTEPDEEVSAGGSKGGMVQGRVSRLPSVHLGATITVWGGMYLPPTCTPVATV